MRESFVVEWDSLRTPLGLPGMSQAVCTRTSYLPTRDGMAERKPDVRFHATSLSASRADGRRLEKAIQGHWGIEDKLHHPKDRTWLEDRHWVGNSRTAAALAMLRSTALDVSRRARLPGLDPKAYFPERIEYFQKHPDRAAALVVQPGRL